MQNRETDRSGMHRAVRSHPLDHAAASLTLHLYSMLAPIFAGAHPGSAPAMADRLATMVRNTSQGLVMTQMQLDVVGTQLCFEQRRSDPLAPDHNKSLMLARWLSEIGIVRVRFSAYCDQGSVERLVQFVTLLKSGQTPNSTTYSLGEIEVGFALVDEGFERLLVDLSVCHRLPLLMLYADGLARVVDLDLPDAEFESQDAFVATLRLGAQLVDALRADASGMLSLLHLRPVPSHPEVLRWDTTILATALALAIGFRDTQAMELAAASLCSRVHPRDSAWVAMPLDPGPAARACGGLPELSTILTFESLLGQGRVVPIAAYGDLVEKHVASLVFEVARAYVDLVHGRPDLPNHTPAAAVLRMIAHTDSRFDSDVIAGLVNLLGFYPPGSAVQLNTGEAAVVVDAPPPGCDLRRPAVRMADLSAADVFRLHDPALAAYSVAGPVRCEDCDVNPIYVALL